MIFAIQIPERARSGSGPYVNRVHAFMTCVYRSAMLSGSEGGQAAAALVKIKIRRESTWSMRNFAATG